MIILLSTPYSRMKQVSIHKFIFRIIPRQQVNIGCAIILAQLDGVIKRSFSAYSDFIFGCRI